MDDVIRVAQKAWRTALSALNQVSSLMGNLFNSAFGTVSFLNSGAISAAASIIAPAPSDVSAVPVPPSGKLIVAGAVFARHSAVDTACVFQLLRDAGTTNTPIGPALTSDSSHVNANATMAIPSFVDSGLTPGALHKYGVRVSTASGTVQVLAANEAEITIVSVPGLP